MLNYNNKIIKSNILIKSYMSHMTVTEYKIFNHMIRMIGFEDKNLRTTNIEVVDINCNALNRSTCNALYGEIKYNFSKSLLKKDFGIPLEKNQIDMYNIFSNIKTKDGSIDVCLNADLEKFLVDDAFLKEYGYTTLDAEILNSLNSFSSMRIYEIMKSSGNIKEFTFTIEEIKKMLGIENKYKKFNGFKEKVLEYSLKDINKNSDINLDYEFIKIGRSYISIKMKKKVKKNFKTKNIFKIPSVNIDEKIVKAAIEKENTENFIVNDICKKFSNIASDYPLDRELIRGLLKEFGEESIYKYLNDWQKYMYIKNMRNPAKLFYVCIKNKIDIWQDINSKPHDAPSSSYNGKPEQSKNFEQREYDDEFFENLYDNF